MQLVRPFSFVINFQTLSHHLYLDRVVQPERQPDAIKSRAKIGSGSRDSDNYSFH